MQQFGGSFGGPVHRNQLWFFLDYEQQRENDPISVINPPLVTSQPGFLSSNFGIPDGTTLPTPNAAYPVAGADTLSEPNLASDPVYFQQVANTIGALNANLGIEPRQKNDIVVTPRFDYQPTSQDSFFLAPMSIVSTRLARS